MPVVLNNFFDLVMLLIKCSDDPKFVSISTFSSVKQGVSGFHQYLFVGSFKRGVWVAPGQKSIP